jgi:hypothetical protein
VLVNLKGCFPLVRHSNAKVEKAELSYHVRISKLKQLKWFDDKRVPCDRLVCHVQFIADILYRLHISRLYFLLPSYID